MFDRKKVTVKGVDREAWDLLIQMRQDEQRFCGAVLSDCIIAYWEQEYACPEDCADAHG